MVEAGGGERSAGEPPDDRGASAAGMGAPADDGPAPAGNLGALPGDTGAPPQAPAPPPGQVFSSPGIAAPTRGGSWFAGLDPRGWRTTIAVAVLMISALVGANFANAAVPLPAEPATPVDPGPALPGPTVPPDGTEPADPGPVSPGTPVDVGFGLVLYPPAGWSVVGSDTGQVVLQKASAVILAAAVPFDGTPAELGDAYRASFFEGERLTAGEPESVQVGNGVPAVSFPYTGVFQGAQVDGVIVAGVSGATGVIVNALAPTGGLSAARDDLEVILGTLQLTPGGGG